MKRNNRKNVFIKVCCLIGIEVFSICIVFNTIIKEKKQLPTNVVLQSSKLTNNQEKKCNLSKKEIYLLEKMVMAEAEGEPYLGQVAVANVILNRVNSKGYPNTVKEVLFQRKQFSPIANKRFFRVKPNNSCKKAVKETLKGRKVINNDVYYFIDKRIATDLYVPKHCKFVKRIGNHWFYKNKKKTIKKK